MSPRKWRGLSPLEKSVAKGCDSMMEQMGWTVIKFSSFTFQTSFSSAPH